MVRDSGYCLTIVYFKTGSWASCRGASTEDRTRWENKENLLGHVEPIANEMFRRRYGKGIWIDGLQGSVIMG